VFTGEDKPKYHQGGIKDTLKNKPDADNIKLFTGRTNLQLIVKCENFVDFWSKF
jgi:hypothetical protein